MEADERMYVVKRRQLDRHEWTVIGILKACPGWEYQLATEVFGIYPPVKTELFEDASLETQCAATLIAAKEGGLQPLSPGTTKTAPEFPRDP